MLGSAAVLISAMPGNKCKLTAGTVWCMGLADVCTLIRWLCFMDWYAKD